MLARDVIDRTFSEFLYPADANRPPFDVLASDITDSSPTLTLEGRLGQNAIPDDSVFEIGSELFLNEDTNGLVLTPAQRGWAETTAAAHTAGAIVWVDPEYPRQVVQNALSSVLLQLPALGVYAPATDTTSTLNPSTTLSGPTGAKRVISVRVRETASSSWRWLKEGVHYEQFEDVEPVEIQWTRAVNAVKGSALRINFAKDFSEIASESDNLTTMGVPTTLQPYLSWAIAGLLLQGREPSRVQVETAQRALATAGVPVGAATSVGSNLVRAFEQVYVQRERKRQRQKQPHSIVRVR